MTTDGNPHEHRKEFLRDAERNGTVFTYCDPKRGGCGLANETGDFTAEWTPLPKKKPPAKRAEPAQKTAEDVASPMERFARHYMTWKEIRPLLRDQIAMGGERAKNIGERVAESGRWRSELDDDDVKLLLPWLDAIDAAGSK